MKEQRKEPSQSGVLIVGVGASRGLGAAIAVDLRAADIL
jgi:hypothetical protein